jgi:hypothetical protein
MTKEEAEIWRRGYEQGIRNTLKENEDAIAIGKSIISVLDSRYEFKDEND